MEICQRGLLGRSAKPLGFVRGLRGSNPLISAEPCYTVTMKTQILKLREQGYSYNQIVAELGCAKSTVSYYCGQDQKVKQLNRQRDKRSKMRAFIQESKTSVVCMDCGNAYPYFIMEFDHRPDEIKLYTISNLNTIPTMEVLLDEIAKCDIVCSNCHKFRTWERLIVSGDSLNMEVPAERWRRPQS